MIIHYIKWEKHFCRYCLQAFSIKEILKRHIKDCFKINGKQRIIMPRKGECVKFKNYERNIFAYQKISKKKQDQFLLSNE